MTRSIDVEPLQLVVSQGQAAQQHVVIDISAERQQHSFSLAAGGGAVTIGLQLPDRSLVQGFVHLFRLRIVRSDNGDAGSPVLQWKDGSEIAAACRLEDLRHGHSALGDVFTISGPRPALHFDLPASAGVAGALRLEIEMSAPYSRDYAVAYDAFVQQENDYITRIRELEFELIRHRRFKREIEEIKRSKVWRLAEAYRSLVFDRLLGRLPLLRDRALRATRGEATRSDTGVPSGALQDGYRYQFDDQQQADIEQMLDSQPYRPLISIIMPVYNVDTRWLQAAVDSVKAQLYSNWELCIVDDASTSELTRNYLKTFRHPRIRIRYLDGNRGISGATNEAIRFARGDYLAFLDNDDTLAPDALYQMVRAINDSSADLLYSDEDFIELDGSFGEPHYKPDFSPDLLLSHNYMTHLVVVKKSLAEQVGLLRSQYDGAQDHDFLLRATEHAQCIHHVPRVLYHWRRSETSTSYSADAKPGALLSARLAVEDALQRRGIDGEVLNEKEPFFFRIRRRIADQPLVSIIIPFRDKPELLRQCVESIVRRSTWPRYEIVAVSNNSRSSETFALVHDLEQRYSAFRTIELNEPFNFSRLVNFGAAQANGDYLLLLNNDIEVISWDWIEAMLEHAQRDEVGAVGAKLYYPNNTIQHAGIIMGLGGYAGHSHKLVPADSAGYFNRLHVVQNVSAVTGACLMVSRRHFELVGGFDEQAFKVAYNDVDFCLRLRQQGLLNIFTPYAELYHHESISRGYEDSEEKQRRFSGEKRALRERHGAILEQGDPYYNPNLTHDREDFSRR